MGKRGEGKEGGRSSQPPKITVEWPSTSLTCAFNYPNGSVIIFIYLPIIEPLNCCCCCCCYYYYYCCCCCCCYCHLLLLTFLLFFLRSPNIVIYVNNAMRISEKIRLRLSAFRCISKQFVLSDS